MTTINRLVSWALLLSLLLACSKEPYPLEGVLTGELPDQDLDVEAELADPGGEMHEPPPDDGEYGSAHCTPEELEEHRKSNTFGEHVNDEGIVCRKRPVSPAPAEPAPVTR